MAHRIRFLSAVTILLVVDLAADVTAEPPTLSDDRLELTLFAEDPDIVTPIGMAIDARDRVFVIESHTHSPPDDYDGPDSDRIKVFVDNDNDGSADEISVFADGIHQAMNLAFSPDGELYVVCAREVLHLVDSDHDGKCDRKHQVLKLVTEQRYAHNSLLSITFDRDRWMYIGRGNTGSDAYRFVGHDDTFVEGFGDGGSVVRCRPDGTQISEFATGFWNPFDLKFDRTGQLLLVDNDPDARGPNRLLKVVHGGDYGYKSMFGGSGMHPFQGWDGSLPGTLPYLAGTGEAPSGLIDCRRSSFPADYRQSILATIWNENSIEHFELHPETGNLLEKSIFLQGDQDFRPVALDCDRRGNLFITDWVLVNYPNHGRGRIWRVSTRDNRERLTPERYFDDYRMTQSRRVLDRLGQLDGPAVLQELSRGRLADPFQRHAAVMRLAGDGMREERHACLQGDAAMRMTGLLASKRVDLDDVDRIKGLLLDPDPEIRRAALMWAAESMDVSLAHHLSTSLTISPVTPELFATYLAASEVLTNDFVMAYRMRSPSKANKLPRLLDPKLLLNAATADFFSPAVRSLAIKRFDRQMALGQMDFLVSLFDHPQVELTVASIETLAALELAEPQVERILRIAGDTNRPALVRTQALAAIAEINGFDPQRIVFLKTDPSPQVAAQARRTLFSLRPSDSISDQHPASLGAWQTALAVGGDPLLGRHVFYSSRVGCSNCHSMDGRGGTLGPGLAGVGKSKSRKQIIDSILDPSASFAPQYQAWIVLTVDGTIHRGLQLDHKAQGAIVLTLENGESRYFKAAEIDAYRATPNSLMPSGLEKRMTVDEFRDLIAYLTTLEN